MKIVTVLGSPRSRSNTTAQFKTFFDRTRAFLKPDFKTAAVFAE